LSSFTMNIALIDEQFKRDTSQYFDRSDRAISEFEFRLVEKS